MTGCVRPDLLSLLVDGGCSPDERSRLYDHIGDCAGCRETFEAYSRVQLLVGRLPRLSAPPQFVARLLESPPVVSGWGRIAAGPRKYLLVAAVLVFAVSAAGVAMPPTDDPPPIGTMMTRHAGVSSASDVSGQIVFAVNGH